MIKLVEYPVLQTVRIGDVLNSELGIGGNFYTVNGCAENRAQAEAQVMPMPGNAVVRFRTPNSCAQVVINARNAAKWAEERYNTLNEAVYLATRTDSFVTCMQCSSRLNRGKMLESISNPNFCPLCGYDLRTRTKLDQIEAAKKRWEAAEKKLAAVEARSARRGPEKWLVKIELPDKD